MGNVAVGVARGLSFRADGAGNSRLRASPAPVRICARTRWRRIREDFQGTNLDAVDAALAAPGQARWAHRLAARQGFTFDPLRSLVKTVKSQSLIVENGRNNQASWDSAGSNRKIAPSLADAVERARSLPVRRRLSVLSGHSSFDYVQKLRRSRRIPYFRKLVQNAPMKRLKIRACFN